jgi:hypothetical protein
VSFQQYCEAFSTMKLITLFDSMEQHHHAASGYYNCRQLNKIPSEVNHGHYMTVGHLLHGIFDSVKKKFEIEI